MPYIFLQGLPFLYTFPFWWCSMTILYAYCNLGQGLGGWGGVMYVCVVSLDYLCRWQVQVSVYCARQCSILLHLIDICFLTCICLWQISQIQTCFRVIVGPRLVSTSPAFMSSIATQPVGGVDTICSVSQTAVTAPTRVGCVVWSLKPSH